MYDDEDREELVEMEQDNEFCEDCPFYRQRPPIFGPIGPQFPPGPMGPGVGPGLGPGILPIDRPPLGPPPAIKPNLKQQADFGVMAIDPGAIRRCMNRFVYLQLDNGREFWAWLIFVGRRSVSGWRWNGFRWVYFGIDLRRIDSFYCY